MRLTLLLVGLLLGLAVCADKLIMVQELFRHGARYPIYPNKFDMSEYALADNSIGELTTQGKTMHYLLGKKMKPYWEQLFENNPFTNPINNSRLYVKSTDVNRTIESCQSHLMGLFEHLAPLAVTDVEHSMPLWNEPSILEPGDVFKNAPAFHPFPIHVEKTGSQFNHDGDFLRAYSPENCPQQQVWQKSNQQTQFVQEIYNNKNFTKSLEALSKALNQTVSFEKAGEFFDNFETTSYLSKPTLPIYSDPAHKRNF